MAEFGYMAMAYISGIGMTAIRTSLLRPFVMWRTNSIHPIRKIRLETAVKRQYICSHVRKGTVCFNATTKIIVSYPFHNISKGICLGTSTK